MNNNELTALLENVITKYGITAKAAASARALDPRALKMIGGIVGSRACLISPLDCHEVTKWGISWETSRFPELRALA